MQAGTDKQALTELISNLLAKELRLNIAEIRADEALTSYGLDSIAALTIAGELEEAFHIELPSTLLWDCPTIDALASHLEGILAGKAQSEGVTA